MADGRVPEKRRSSSSAVIDRFRAFGWFVCAAMAGGVAMLGGLRMVFFVTAGLFFLLVPVILFTATRLRDVEAASRNEA